MADPRVEALRRVPLFAAMPERHLRKVARRARVSEYPAETTILEEGKPGRSVFVVTEGRVRVTQSGRTIRRLGAGDFFGEIAVIDGAPRSASVVAETALRCIALDREPFLQLLETDPPVAWPLLRTMASRLRGAAPADRRLLDRL